MYISKFHIKNFRGIKETTLLLRKGLNVLIGENNCGKTAVVDALRLALSISSQRRDISMTIDDFFCDDQGNVADNVELDLTFNDITAIEGGVFYEMLVTNTDNVELQLHVRYAKENRGGIDRWRFKYWGGEKEGQQVPPEVLELLYYVHLGALRDASIDLSPRRGNRLGQLFLKLKKDPEQQKHYTERLQTKFDEDEEWSDLRILAEQKIKAHLDEVSFEDNKHDVKILFVPFEFRQVVENLRMLLKRDTSRSERLFDIEQNGLGYNNLLYIATVLGDLLERKTVEPETYVSLFIEEPEAHLHPQLQDTLFNFLAQIAQRNIQIFLTSHSPTITAKTILESLIVLQPIPGFLHSLSIEKCPLNLEEKRYLERFLDVTKSQLFFSRGVLLVEGISEALLISLFAKRLSHDLDKRGVEIVYVSGTSFRPFAGLFKSSDTTERLSTRCSIITDDDSHINGSVSNRARQTQALEGGALKVFLARKTFEHELWDAGNSPILLDVYREMHPRFSVTSASEFMNALNQNRDKAEFAQLLAHRLLSDASKIEQFEVPDYIKHAIRWVVAGDL